MAKNTASIPAKITGSNYTAAEFETLRGFVDTPMQNSISFTPNFSADGQKKFNDYTLGANETWNASSLEKGNRLVFNLITPGGFTITKGTNLANDFNSLFGSVLAAGTYRVFMNVISATEIDVVVPESELIVGIKEFSNLVHANNAANAVKTFTATPTFAFGTDGNDQQMTLTGNVTSFATSGEVGSADMKVYLINDGSVRTVVAPTGWTADPTSEDHTTAANAINLYQFYTLPDGSKYFNLHIVKA